MRTRKDIEEMLEALKFLAPREGERPDPRYQERIIALEWVLDTGWVLEVEK